jgi:hypothetical protein
MLAAVETTGSANLIWIHRFSIPVQPNMFVSARGLPPAMQTLDEELAFAKSGTSRGSKVLAVKIW